MLDSPPSSWGPGPIFSWFFHSSVTGGFASYFNVWFRWGLASSCPPYRSIHVPCIHFLLLRENESKNSGEIVGATFDSDITTRFPFQTHNASHAAVAFSASCFLWLEPTLSSPGLSLPCAGVVSCVGYHAMCTDHILLKCCFNRHL